MTPSRPFLGETTDREKAFPDIESLELTVAQDPYEHYARHAWQRESRFTKTDIPRRLGCLNPRCQQGGLDLEQIVLFSSPGKHSYYCNGHEGTPKERRKGDPCDNRFDVMLAVVRRPSRSGKVVRSKEQRLGYLRGKTTDGDEVVVSVAKIGRDYRIGYGHRDHLCPPSVRDMEGVKREALLVFHVRDAAFEPQ